MINVTFVHHSLRSGGGSERVIFDLIRGLDSDRFRASLACLYGLGEWGERLRSLGYSTHSNLMSRSYDIRGVRRVAEVLRREQTDILYVSDGMLNMVIARPAAALAKVPTTALAFHSYDTVIRRRASRLARTRAQLIDAAYHPRFSAYVALAQSHKKYLVECKGLDAAKVVVAYNGVVADEYRSDADPIVTRRALGIPEDAIVAVMVASLRRWKAHDVLLKATAEVLRDIPSLHVVLAGDGPERANLDALVRTLSITEQVHFLGKVDDVAGVLGASDLVVLSSEHEAFPLSLLEAMAAGRPIIATNTGSVAEMVIDGVNGHIVEVGAVDQLAAAMRRLLRDPDAAAAMGRAGRRLIDERFTIERTVRAYEAFFEEWAASAEPRRP